MHRISRRTALITLTAGASGMLARTAGAAPLPASSPADGRGKMRNAERAVATYDALQRYLYVGDGSGLYHEQYPMTPDDRPYSYEWPFSQAHGATLDLTGIPRTGRDYVDDLADRAAAQEHYWHPEGGTTGKPGYDSYPRGAYGGGGDFFYDDNEWVGLIKVQQHLMTGDKAALARAKEIFALVVSGWDTDPSHAAPGGVFWTQATWSTDRNTVSNMPGAELGLRLYLVTGDTTYLSWSQRMYDWTNAHLLAPNGLYWDNVKLDGAIDATQWSYNQGVPIGVNVLLHKATGDAVYLQRARAVAAASLDLYVGQGRLDAQGAPFNAIYFKNLLLMESVVGGTTYRRAMQDYADHVWAERRDPATGLMRFADNAVTQAIEQAAMVQIYATLAWQRGHAGTLY